MHFEKLRSNLDPFIKKEKYTGEILEVNDVIAENAPNIKRFAARHFNEVIYLDKRNFFYLAGQKYDVKTNSQRPIFRFDKKAYEQYIRLQINNGLIPSEIIFLDREEIPKIFLKTLQSDQKNPTDWYEACQKKLNSFDLFTSQKFIKDRSIDKYGQGTHSSNIFFTTSQKPINIVTYYPAYTRKLQNHIFFHENCHLLQQLFGLQALLDNSYLKRTNKRFEKKRLKEFPNNEKKNEMYFLQEQAYRHAFESHAVTFTFFCEMLLLMKENKEAPYRQHNIERFYLLERLQNQNRVRKNSSLLVYEAGKSLEMVFRKLRKHKIEHYFIDGYAMDFEKIYSETLKICMKNLYSPQKLNDLMEKTIPHLETEQKIKGYNKRFARRYNTKKRQLNQRLNNIEMSPEEMLERTREIICYSYDPRSELKELFKELPHNNYSKELKVMIEQISQDISRKQNAHTPVLRSHYKEA